MHNVSSQWHQDIHLVKPGNSAIVGDNYLAFYFVHVTGMISTGISVAASAIVMMNILSNQCSRRWDFSDRFPLYLAISDGLWGIINLTTDHLVLLVTQVYPPKEIATLIAVVLGLFLGYQQFMNAGLAVYTYCKVVRHTHIDFGTAEWKLHLICVISLLGIVAVFLPLDGFGSAGYWFLANMQTTSGKYFQLFITTTGTTCTICTLWSYRAIKRAVDKQRKLVAFINLYEGKNSCFHLCTATQCLTTFIYVSLFLYIPMNIVSWIYCLLYVGASTVDPFTAFFTVILANSSGWANAWAYFHNKRIKKLGKLRNTLSSGNKYECRLTKIARKSLEVF